MERPRDLPDLLHAERPDLRVSALEAEVVDRGGRQVAGRALREDGDLRGDVRTGLEVRKRLALLAPALVPRPHPHDPAVVEEQLLAGRLGEDHRAPRLRLIGEEPSELRDRDDPVAVVAHRRRRRDAQRGALGEEIDGLAVHGAVGRHLLDRDPAAEQPADGAGVHDRAREEVRARLLALLEHRDRHLAEGFADVGMLLEELAEPDGAGKPAGAASHDQDPDLDPLVGRVGRRADRLGARERRRVVGRADAAHLGTTSTGVPEGAR